MSNLQDLSCLERIGFRLALIACRILSGFLFIVFTRVWTYRKKIVQKNLAASFPELNTSEQVQLSKKYFRHLADLIVEPLLIGSLSADQLNALVEFENTSLVKTLLRQQKSIVLVASHAGNWEYLLSLPTFTGCDVLAAYSPVSNNWVNSKLNKLRSRFGVRLVAKADWYRTVMKTGRSKPAIFITIADQRPELPGRHCLNFLNQKTFIQPGAARIAACLGCAVVYVDVFKTARNSYRFRFELINDAAGKRDEEEIMERYFGLLEATIRRQPELWLWSHNRWQFRTSQVLARARHESASV